MADETVIATAVEKAAQATDPKTIASELAAAIKPLLQSLDSVELDSKHRIGVILNARLKPDGQKRLTYGGKVMERLAVELDISRSNLNRMSQFASQYPTLADFTANHPEVTTWSKVKELLVQPNSANQRTVDPTRAHLQQCARSLFTYRERFAKSLNGSHTDLVSECQRVAQALAEMFQQHLPTNSTATQNSQDTTPSTPEGDKQVESAALSPVQ
jgi:hypothetical protein